MKLFGWKSTGKGEARPALGLGVGPGWTGGGGLGDWPRGYETQVRSGYLDNAIAQRAVRLVSESVAAAPLTASEPALADLVAARSAGQSLLETVAAHLLLHGNAFVQLLTDPTGRLVELFALRPERVVVEPDVQGWPAAYLYRVGATTTRLVPDGPRPQVVHLKRFHPLDDHYGLGCLGAAAGAIAIHNASTRWNKALLDNAARPSGALIHDPGDGAVLSREQKADMRRQLDEVFSGAGNAGRPMLLDGGLKWQAMSMSPADLDFVELKAAAAREIALAFGAPPMLLGLPGDATYANYREANRALWRLSVLPLADAILSGLGQAVTGWFADARLGIDLDRVAALADDRATLWSMLSGADFLTTDEKRHMVGLS